MSDDVRQPSYPVVKFLVAHGRPIAWGLVAALAFAAVVAGLVGPWWLIPLGLAAAAVLLPLLLSYVEVLRIISDTLLPRW